MRDSDGTAWIDAATWTHVLTIRLSDLGCRDAALAAAEEAVSHHRVLADTRPDVFTPDLITALETLGLLQASQGAAARSATSFTAVIERLTPAFATLPLAFQDQVIRCVDAYTAQCRATGLTPATAVLAGVEACLNPSPLEGVPR